MFAATKSFFTNEAAPGGGPTPSWTLDFSSGTPSGYTLTRLGTAATYVDSSGYIASAGQDVARLTHNSSGSRLGLLVEEQRQNLCLRSEDFGTTWTTSNMTTTSYLNTDTAPDNTTTADKLIANTTNGTHWFSQVVNTGQGLTRTFSVFLKKGGSDYGFVAVRYNSTADSAYVAVYDLTNGNRTATNSIGTFTNESSPATAEDYGNGWYRVWVTVTTSTVSGTQLHLRCGPTTSGTPSYSNGFPTYAGAAGDATNVLAWGAQLEAASTPSSYIATVGSAVTRSADLAHVLDSSITSWGDPGALVLHFYPPGQAGTLLSTDDAAAEQLGIEASSTTAVRAFWSSGQTNPGTMTTGVQKAVHYWNGTASSFCLNGGTVETGTNNVTTFGNIDFVTFGAQATDSSGSPGTYTDHSNLVIRKIEFYSGTLTSGDLQTITT